MRPHALPTGTELGGYVLHGVLGTGASGTVYRATDAEGLPVALKLLHPEVAAGTDARIRLRREVTAQRSIRSPFVAKVVDAELDQAEAFVVTEQISGRTLEAAVAQGGAWSTDQLAELGDYLLQAVDAVHAAGVLHRDIKPANVMLREDGTPVLIDFGIAQDDTSARLTGTGQVVGTPGFVAAELLRGQNPTPATDRFAAAATLLRAATGRAPFGGGPIDAVLARVLEGSPDTAGLPEPIQQAFRAALSPVEASRLLLDALIRALQSGVFHEDLPPTAAFGGPAMPLQPLPPAAGEAGAALPDRFGHTAEGHRVAPGPAPPADATQPFDPEGHRELLPPVWDESPGLFPPGAAGAPEGLGPPDRLGPLGQPGLAALPAAGPDLGVPGLDDAAAQDLPGPAWRPLPSPDEVSPPKRRVLVACLRAAAAV
ncbi:MAG: serine/threonine protein kinase, partial [Bifidobacteriaceae bacterium]|nr:serine/threonine protein kinase [Bifidobacteriaceae bacterium]